MPNQILAYYRTIETPQKIQIAFISKILTLCFLFIALH